MTDLITPYNPSSILPWEEEYLQEKTPKGAPKISIVIPIYNSAQFLEKTLRSLLYNDLSNVELILMDGGSKDHTMQIVQHYSDMFTHIVSEPDKGQSDAINKGYERATGDILYWLNGDDIILPNTLSKVGQYFVKNPNCDVLVGNAYMTELDFSPINHFIFSPEKLKFNHLLDYARNHLVQPSVFFTRAAWEKAGPLDINDHYAMDADLFIGMAKHFELEHINIDIAYSVYHEDCKTRGARAESITSLALVQAKHGGLREAKNTLDVLIGLHKELEQKMETEDSVFHREQVLQAKIGALTAHTERQKELLLKMDMDQHS